MKIDTYVGVVLVVSEQDVVFRQVALDHLVLEKESIDLGVGLDPVCHGDMLNQLGGHQIFGATVKVLTDSIFENGGFAHVDYFTRLIFMKVNTG